MSSTDFSQVFFFCLVLVKVEVDIIEIKYKRN